MFLFHFHKFSILQRDDVFKITTDALVLAGLTELEEEYKSVLDVGSGTGVLSLLLKDRFPHLEIMAIDINEEAVGLTQLNFSNYYNNEGLSVLHSPVGKIKIPPVDLIISNPPYFSNSLAPSRNWKALARHDTDFGWEVFFKQAQLLTSPHGTLNIIIKTQELDRLKPYYQEEGWHLARQVFIHDTQKDRPLICFLCFVKQNVSTIASTLILKNTHGRYTPEYLQLLKGWVDWN